MQEQEIENESQQRKKRKRCLIRGNSGFDTKKINVTKRQKYGGGT